MSKRSILKFAAVAALTLFPLTACELQEEGHVTDKRIQVGHERFSEQVSLSEANNNYIASTAQDFKQGGGNALDVSVIYDPRASQGSAIRAEREAQRLAAAFNARGIKNVTYGALPIQGQGDEFKVMISFDNYVAHPPEDCAVMEGFEDRPINLDQDYKLGCTVETVFARQIAHPRDLTGETELDPTTDGRRASNIVERYRSGVPNAKLEGETSSEK